MDIEFKDFQLNTIKQGDYIPKSELDTEDKYNRAVEVFGLLGFELGFNIDYISANSYPCMFVTHREGIGFCDKGSEFLRREITFNQLIAIGELKSLMNERDYSKRVADLGCYDVNSTNKNKSQKAYEILESLDYEFDSGKGRRYRKEWV